MRLTSLILTFGIDYLSITQYSIALLVKLMQLSFRNLSDGRNLSNGSDLCQPPYGFSVLGLSTKDITCQN